MGNVVRRGRELASGVRRGLTSGARRVVGNNPAVNGGRQDELLARVDQLQATVDQLSTQLAQVSSTQGALAGLPAQLEEISTNIWASKVTRVGDRLLVGCRHLNLVFYLDADDVVIGPRFMVDGEYEPLTTGYFLETVGKDDICVDVGANFGYYTCMLAHLAWEGRVLAFEADPWRIPLCQDNIKINWSLTQTELRNQAVGADVGTLTMHRWDQRSANTGILAPHDGEATEFEVDTIPLDSLVGELPKVDVVKVDVEGAEHLVLAGMKEFTRHFRPRIVMEWSPGQIDMSCSRQQMLDLFDDLNLQPHTIGPGAAVSEVSLESLLTAGFQNLVLTPH